MVKYFLNYSHLEQNVDYMSFVYAGPGLTGDLILSNNSN